MSGIWLVLSCRRDFPTSPGSCCPALSGSVYIDRLGECICTLTFTNRVLQESLALGYDDPAVFLWSLAVVALSACGNCGVEMADPTACKDVIKSIARCLHQSACIKEGHTVAQCFNGHDVPECDVRGAGLERVALVLHNALLLRPQKYRKAFFECRRGQLDMRTRYVG